MNRVNVALAPDGVRDWLGDAIRAGGGTVLPADRLDDADALVWAEPAKATELHALLTGPARNVRWVQLPWAGIEPYLGILADEVDAGRTWTCAKGVYAEPVAEHALALLLAGLRNIGQYARASSWTGPHGTSLATGHVGRKVTIVGGGGITESLLRLLAPLHADVTVVRRSRPAEGMPGAARVVGVDQLDDALDGAIGVVLALAL